MIEKCLPGLSNPESVGRDAFGIVFHARVDDPARAGAGGFRAVRAFRLPDDAGDAAGRLRHDLERTATVDHPHLLGIERFRECDGAWFVASPVVDGLPVGEFATVGGRRLTEAEALLIGEQIAAALAALHARGVVHGRVDPSAIALRRSGAAVLAHAGLATLTTAHPFSAPELRSSRFAPTPAGDVASLAATLHYLVHGTIPGRSATPAAEAGEPADLDGLVRRCYGSDAATRPDARWLADRCAAVRSTNPGAVASIAVPEIDPATRARASLAGVDARSSQTLDRPPTRPAASPTVNRESGDTSATWAPPASAINEPADPPRPSAAQPRWVWVAAAAGVVVAAGGIVGLRGGSDEATDSATTLAIAASSTAAVTPTSADTTPASTAPVTTAPVPATSATVPITPAPTTVPVVPATTAPAPPPEIDDPTLATVTGRIAASPTILDPAGQDALLANVLTQPVNVVAVPSPPQMLCGSFTTPGPLTAEVVIESSTAVPPELVAQPAVAVGGRIGWCFPPGGPTGFEAATYQVYLRRNGVTSQPATLTVGADPAVLTIANDLAAPVCTVSTLVAGSRLPASLSIPSGLAPGQALAIDVPAGIPVALTIRDCATDAPVAGSIGVTAGPQPLALSSIPSST